MFSPKLLRWNNPQKVVFFMGEADFLFHIKNELN